MADHSKLDSQFILNSNKTHHKETKDQMIFTLHSIARSNNARLETTTSPQDLRTELRSLYTFTYDDDDDEFGNRCCKLLHESIQKMQSNKKKQHKSSNKKKSTSSITAKHSTSSIAKKKMAIKSKRRQRRKPKEERLERFSAAWNQSILHKKIKVYWPLDNKYYRGIVSAINQSKPKPIYVKYRDGDKEWLNLKNENFMFYHDTETSSDDVSTDHIDIDDDDDDDDDDENEEDHDGDYNIIHRDNLMEDQDDNDDDDDIDDDEEDEDDDIADDDEEEGEDEEDEDDDMIPKKRKTRRKSDKKKKKKKKKRKKKKQKKSKSTSKSPKSDKKKKRKKEMMESKDIKKKERIKRQHELQKLDESETINNTNIDIINRNNMIYNRNKAKTMDISEPEHASNIEQNMNMSQDKKVETEQIIKNDENEENESLSSKELILERMSEDSNGDDEGEEDGEDTDDDDDGSDDSEDSDIDNNNNDNDNEPEKDPLIDSHVTIIIDGNRYDGIVEQSRDGDVEKEYKIQFDSSNEKESEWVTRSQIEIQEITTCDRFEIGDQVEVRENEEWMEIVGKVNQIYQGATGIIVQVSFPEFEEDEEELYMYLQERDVRKKQ